MSPESFEYVKAKKALKFGMSFEHENNFKISKAEKNKVKHIFHLNRNVIIF